ncbi:hypothetical protein TRAPUB_13240 [Trametes pubescens]|uniref:Uncharacterized protein n=1 Tax=Trametes pubescens TaxID=154538 RepID=A0A1M2VRM1_TRAPU|nr:hypothetical protein TRAPUB_13240 [Trametes pubescens]
MAPISTSESTITDGGSFTTLFICEDFCRSIIVPISTGAGSQAPPTETAGVTDPLSSSVFVPSATGSTTSHTQLSASAATQSPSDRPKNTFTFPAAPASEAHSSSDRPLTTLTLPAFTPTSTSASASASPFAPRLTATSERDPEVPSSRGMTSHASASSPATSSRAPQAPQTSSSGSSVASITTAAEPVHRVSRIPTPALAGAIVSAVLATAVAGVIFRLWLRRRRTHALLSTQSSSSDMSRSAARDLSPSMAAVSCSRVLSKSQAEDSVAGVRTRTRSVASDSESGSSRGARCGSATVTSSLEPSPSSRSLLAVHADRKNDQQGLPRPPSPVPAPPSMERLPEPRGNSSDGESETGEAHGGERLLHLALPWALGQRMLAMMAGEDPGRVEGEGEETLPANEPRR